MRIFLVLNASGIHAGDCFLGCGLTRADAHESATGDRSKKFLPRGARVEEWDRDEAREAFPDFESEIVSC